MNALKDKLSRLDPRGLVLPALLLVVWQAVTASGWVDTRIVVPPAAVAAAGWRWLSSGEALAGIGASLYRDLAGFALGAGAGIATGLLLGTSRFAGGLLGPTFHTFKHISIFAWIPLLSAFFGRDDLAKIVFIAFATLYPVALATIEGVRAIAPSQHEVARIYGFTPRQALLRLILPAASPQIIAGLHLGLIGAWLATMGAEFLLASTGEGLGMTVIRGRAAFRVDLIVFGMLIIGAFGMLLNDLASRVEARLLHWRGPAR